MVLTMALIKQALMEIIEYTDAGKHEIKKFNTHTRVGGGEGERGREGREGEGERD